MSNAQNQISHRQPAMTILARTDIATFAAYHACTRFSSTAVRIASSALQHCSATVSQISHS